MPRYLPTDLITTRADRRANPSHNLRRPDAPPPSQEPNGAREYPAPDAAPSRVKHSRHPPVLRGQEDRHAVGGEHGQGLARDLREEPVRPSVGFRFEERWHKSHLCAMNLFRRRQGDREAFGPQKAGKRTGGPGVSLAPVRRKPNGFQGCWRMVPLDSEPVWTPRIAIMTSSGLEEASSAVSRVISPLLMR